MEINKAFFVGMDGGADHVADGIDLARDYGDILNAGETSVGTAIDITLLACFNNAENTDEFRRHLDYVISQLQVVQRNARGED